MIQIHKSIAKEQTFTQNGIYDKDVIISKEETDIYGVRTVIFIRRIYFYLTKISRINFLKVQTINNV